MEEMKMAIQDFLEEHTIAELIELIIETVHEGK